MNQATASFLREARVVTLGALGAPLTTDTCPASPSSPAPWPGLALRWLDALTASHGSLRSVRSAVLRDLALPEGATARLPGPGAGPPRSSGSSALVDREQLARRVSGKVVLITGGSSGIGLQTARRLAAAGAITLICGRDLQKLADAEQQIASDGGQVRADAVDLADPSDCDEFVHRLLDRHGTVDVLINNAGRSIRRSVHSSLDRFHDFQRTMQLNYFAALRLTLGLLPAMAKQRQGHVINISSLAVLMGSPRFSAYAASKAALDAWTRCTASEYADLGIDFTTIHMPLVRTPMIAPTQSYERVPALRPEQAAELVMRAIVQRPARITTSIGALADAAQTVAPHWMRSLGNYLFRSAP